ncbi:MAG: adenylate/guanylate cyclase domain-containing protein, partial [Alphaproteobacteria bacterium]
MERRLAAILAADVVGYSRLVRADEEGTLDRVKTLLGELIEPTIAEYRGRIVKLMGDAVLAEFASVVDAVRAAAEIQSSAPARNAGLPADKHIEMRVGINLGDVVIDDGDIHGDGVNVAARLEALAPPGGICISGAVRDQVRDRVDLRFEDTGAQKVKNIDRPISTYVWRPDTDAPARTPAPTGDTNRKPTVAFTPLDAVGRNEDAEVLAAAITEAVVAALSNQTGLSLITDPSQADYLVKGGVQARGSRYRATVQVHDCRSGDQFAADRYDGDPGDVFDAQDELASRISTTVRFAILAREYERAGDDGETQSSTQALLTKAGGLLLAPRHADWKHARELTDLVIAREPANFMALAIKAWTHLAEPLCGYKDMEPQDRAAAVAAARQAVRLNEQSDFAHLTRATVYLY